MARLSNVPAKLGAAPPRVGKAPKHEQGRLIRQRDNPEYRAWYNTNRWRDIKQEAHLRDAFRCQAKGCGRICAGKYPADDSPTADHKNAHRGNPVLFWDPTNVQTMCKACHDKDKQREEQESLRHRGVWD